MSEIIPTSEVESDLTDADQCDLDRLEKVIDKGRRAFVEVGSALLEIRERKLYRQTHDTFEKYVKDRFDIGRAHAYRLLDAKVTMEALSPIGDIPLPATESQCRPLLRFEPEHRAEVWRDVLGLMQRKHNGKITEKDINFELALLIRDSKSKPYKTLRKKRRDQRRQVETKYAAERAGQNGSRLTEDEDVNGEEEIELSENNTHFERFLEVWESADDQVREKIRSFLLNEVPAE